MGERLPTTTIIQQQGPSAAPVFARAQQMDATMREEIYTADKVGTPQQVAAALQKISRHQDETTSAARSFPMFGGTYHTNVSFTANTAVTLAHGCQIGLQVAWWPLSLRPVGAVANAMPSLSIGEVTQSPSTGRITLSSNEACTADLYFFTRPVAT